MDERASPVAFAIDYKGSLLKLSKRLEFGVKREIEKVTYPPRSDCGG